MPDYDVVTIGGGLGGSTLARALASRGLQVLVLEREERFRDRVRGEGLVSWGVEEAHGLGLLDLLRASCAHELPWWDVYLNGERIAHRPLRETTPSGQPILSFFHPRMQEALLASASEAGAVVRRGIQARRVRAGDPPRVTYAENGDETEVTARLVVGADGRGSLVRARAGFETQADPPGLRVTGVLLADMHGASPDTARLAVDVRRGRQAVVFPLGDGRARAYVVTRHEEGIQLHGQDAITAFLDLAAGSGMADTIYEGARPVGPLATYEGAACWATRPYRDGVALVGDAAMTSDPSWGQGLALTLRSVRLLRDALDAHEDWDAAGHAYADAQVRTFERMRAVELLYEQLFMEQGPDAEAKRARAMPVLARDPTLVPDHLFGGPDLPLNGPIAEIYAAA